MMNVRQRWDCAGLILTIVSALSACGRSPTSPSTALSSISVTGTVPALGQSSQFTAKATLSNGTSQDVTTQATWQSSNTAVVTVSATGVVTAQGVGTAEISASYQNATGKLPVSLAVTLTSVQVGAAGNASTRLQPGQTLQLWALAKYSDGVSSDVTNASTWQSSNPVVATVSSEGTLRAAAAGDVDVVATYQKVQGAVHAVVLRPGCDATTLSPGSLTFNAFGQYGFVTVTTPLSDCYWTAQSDASWLKLKFDPGRSGSGSFQYQVPVNNYPNARTANIIVTVTGGVTLAHTVSQQAPASCSYVVTPAEASFTAAGGSGFFDVVTTPADCRWTATSEYGIAYGVPLTGATTGTGAGRVTYTVTPSFRSYAVSNPIEVAGLSGANPPATHTVHIAAR
jgi:hypothetical protein